MIFYKNHPEIHDCSNMKLLLDIYDKGPLIVSKNRNSEGCRLLIIRHKILDELNVTLTQGLTLDTLVNGAMILEPETQISGLILVNDMRGVTMNYLSLFQMDLISKMISLMGFMPGRIKQINIIGLPTFANAILEVAKTFMSEKIRNRVNLCRNVEGLKDLMDVTNLTTEYGGTVDMEDCIRSYRKNAEESGQSWQEFIKNVKFDDEKLRKYEMANVFEYVGSFRNLEID